MSQQTMAATFLVAVLVGVLSGCGRTPDAHAAPVAKTASPPPSYAQLLADLEARIAAAQADSQQMPQSWGLRERLSALYLEHAQLSGRYEDFDLARKELDQAEAQAGSPEAVCLTRARLEFSLHRLVEARAAVARCEQRFGLTVEQWQELQGLSAEIALYQGRYSDALAAMRADLASGETLAGLTRLSRFHAKTGQRVEALALLDRAEASYHGDSAQFRSWLQLQRAIVELETGRWENSLAWLHAARRELRGWWLVDEHFAEVQTLLGETAEARALYRDIVQRTGLPEYLSAAAALEETTGNASAAREMDARASELFRERLRRWPEAAAGHALDHFLRLGDDGVVAMAELNGRARPYGDAQVQLAQAYLQVGRVQDARRVITSALKTPWSTGELHWTAARVLASAGEARDAERHRLRALELNPRAEKQYGAY